MMHERLVAVVVVAVLGAASPPAWADPSPDALKRGFAGNTATFINAMNANWHYNWGWTPSSASRGEYIPMAWNASAITNASNFAKLTGHSSDWILGFNEPERLDQANMTVARAIQLWPQLMATGKKLVSPAVSDDTAGRAWLTDFMTQINQKGYRVDAVAFHWYGDVRPANAASGFLSRVDWFQNNFENNSGQNYPIWVTEFAGVDWTGGANPVTQEMNRTFMEGALAGLDSRSYVDRYAWWSYNPENSLGAGSPYTPTTVGKLYNGRSYDEGQTLTLAGNEGDDTFYLYGGKITNTVSGRSIRFLDVLEELSEVGGTADWGVTDGWARVRSGATLRKFDANTVSFTGIDVSNDGELHVKGGVLRFNDGAGLKGSGLLKVETGSFVDLEQTAPGTGITVDNDVEMAAGRLRAKAGAHTLNGNLIMSSTSTVDVAESLTVKGQVTGSTNLTKSGVGVLTLTGNNSHTGSMTISAGTVEVGGSGTLGGGDYAGNIFNSATLKVNSTANQILRGVISNVGGLVKDNTGTLTVKGTNTYGGTTEVNAGVLSISANSNLGSQTAATALRLRGGTLQATESFGLFNGSAGTNNRAVILTNQSGIDVASGKTFVIAGGISGSGGFNKSGAGQLDIYGNTFTGPTVVNEGVLRALQATSLATTSSITVQNGGSLYIRNGHTFAQGMTLNGSGAAGALFTQIAGTTQVNGTVTLGSHTLVQQGTGTTLNISGPIQLGAHTLTSNIGGTNPATFGNAITGTGGLTKSGGGTLILSGTNLFTGATTVDGGSLLVNGTIAAGAAVAVNNNAVLGGKGAIARTVALNDTSTLSPGDSTGQLTVAALTLGVTSNTLMELGGATPGTLYDNLTISPGGALTYGGSLKVEDVGTFDLAAVSRSYDLFAFGSTLPSGSFASITVDGVALQDALNSGLWTGQGGSAAYRFDQATGDLLVTVPEPASVALLAAGVTHLLRRRNGRERGGRRGAPQR